MNNPRVQAMFKRSSLKILFVFIISQDYCDLPKGTIRAHAKIYHIFKRNNFRDTQNLYQDKTSMVRPLTNLND